MKTSIGIEQYWAKVKMILDQIELYIYIYIYIYI